MNDRQLGYLLILILIFSACVPVQPINANPLPDLEDITTFVDTQYNNVCYRTTIYSGTGFPIDIEMICLPIRKE